MERARTVARVEEIGLVPILRTKDTQDAEALAEILADGGIPIVEIPLTVPGALGLIAALARRHGERLLVGAGTVLDPAAAAACVDAGARFVISPAVNLETIAWCRGAGVPIFAGALTPTEIVAAWRAGADMVKVFPVSAVGGASYIQAVKAPLPEIKLLPTGGVSLETAAAFVEAGASALGVGSDLVDAAALAAGRGADIAARARRYVAIVRAARV